MENSKPPISLSLAELAAYQGLQVIGDAQTRISGVGTLINAGPAQLSFLSNPSYRKHLSDTNAGAVVVSESDAKTAPCPAIIAKDPYLAYARIAARFAPQLLERTGQHPMAAVEAGANVHPTSYIAAHATVESGAEIGPGVLIGAGSYIGRGTTVGENSVIHPRVTILHDISIGKRVIIHPGVVIGADGFGLAFAGDHWEKVPQLGSVRIGDDCEVGANTTIDRGAVEDTILEEDVRLDNQIQIAHNVIIGAHTAMAGCSAVAGSAKIGRYCLIGGGAGILGHLSIADKVTITSMSLVTHSIKEAGEYSSGSPLQPNKQWRKNAVRLRQLDELARTVNRLNRKNNNGK